MASPGFLEAFAERRLRAPSLAMEAAAAAAAVLLLALPLRAYAYSDTLHEYDLYATAIGLWDGHVSGAGLSGTLHYYLWICFGYIQFLYAIGADATFADRESIVRLINEVGYWATLAIPFFAWLCLRLAYGAAVAASATVLFVLSPIFLEVAGAGHPLLPAVALFFLGGAVMFAAPAGRWRWPIWSVAALILTASLLLRFELAFAFPLLVLAQPRTDSLRAFLVEAARRCAPGVAAIVAYFLIQRALLGTNQLGETRAFLDQWYSLANLGRGAIAAALAAGGGLIAAALGAGWAAFAPVRAKREALARWAAARADWAAPLAVVGAAILFWLPNPLPARHFLMFTFGLSLLVALMLRTRFGAGRLIAASIAIALVSQAAALVSSPLAPLLSPSDLREPAGVLLPAPAEAALPRRAILKARSEAAQDLSRRIVERACGRRLVVITSQAPALMIEFLRPGRRPQITVESAYRGSFRYRLIDGDREVAFIQRENAARARRLVDDVLADPAYGDATVLIDPMTRHIADVREPPPERRETLDCDAR